MNKVLVIVDMQNDFVYGALGSPEAQNIVENIKWKLDCARQNGDLVIFTRDTHYDNYLDTKEGKYLPVKHCIKDTEGWEIVSELTPQDNEIVINKTSFGSFSIPDTILDFYGDTFNIVVDICGVCTDICVISNALILKAVFSEGGDIYVDHQCCAGSNLANHDAALNVMKACQINVV